MYLHKSVLLLDMNGTFMFGEDNFGESEDFSIYYQKIGGKISNEEINFLIRKIYSYLNERYPDESYRHSFPTVELALKVVSTQEVPEDEIPKLVQTFARHEIGYIPNEYINVLHALRKKFKLAVVIDIWAPKVSWTRLFDKLGISELFLVSSFSSDHGMVKPSPKPFEWVLTQLGVSKDQSLVVGDSIRRDLGGAMAAGIDCILVGGAQHPNAIACYENLLEFNRDLGAGPRD